MSYTFKLTYQGRYTYLPAGCQANAYRQFNNGFKSYPQGWEIELHENNRLVKVRTT